MNVIVVLVFVFGCVEFLEVDIVFMVDKIIGEKDIYKRIEEDIVIIEEL